MTACISGRLQSLQVHATTHRVGRINMPSLLRFTPDDAMPSVCNTRPEWLQAQSQKISSSNVDLDLDGRSWRYFSLLQECHRAGAHGDGCTRLLFKDAVSESFVGSISSRDGVHFDSAISVVLNSSWPQAHMTHNTAIATLPQPSSDSSSSASTEYVVVGGQHNRERVRPGERPNDGIWSTRWHPEKHRASHVASNEEARWLLNGSHPGCVERRVEVEGKWLYPGYDAGSRACGFDGRLSLVYHRGQWLLFARANPAIRGHRSVQVSKSIGAQLTPGGWGPFRQIHLRGYPHDADIYFFLVQANPAVAGTLLATFPLYHTRTGCVAIACSHDGVHWSPPLPLIRCPVIDRLGGRTLCHPTNLVPRGGKESLLYVHVSVPRGDARRRRVAGAQPPASLVLHRVPLGVLASLSHRLLAAPGLRPAGAGRRRRHGRKA